MSVKDEAIKDIKIELRKEHKKFIPFRVELNVQINMIVDFYNFEQENIRKWIFQKFGTVNYEKIITMLG